MTALPDVVSTLAAIGHATWRPFWIPVLAWTVWVLPLALALRRAAFHPLANYRADHLLLASLPLSLGATAVLDVSMNGTWLAAWSAASLPASGTGDVFLGGLLERPLLVGASGTSSSVAGPDVLVGLITVAAALVALVGLGRLGADLVGLVRTRRRMRRTTSLLSVSDELADVLPRRSVEVRVSLHAHDVPMALGLAPPLIAVPSSIAADPSALRMTLAHEAVHVRRYDDWAAVGEQLIRALCGWHPLVRSLTNRAALDREQACDAAVLAEGWASPEPYARLLASVATRRASHRVALSLSESSSLLIKRLRTMQSGSSVSVRTPRRSLLGLFPLGLALVVAIAACSDGVAPNEAAPREAETPSETTAESAAPMPRAVEGSGVVANVDTYPSLKEGAATLYDRITYPEAAAADGVEGKVFVQFVVTKDGDVTQAEVKRGPHPALNEEALRVVTSLRFAPAQKDGAAVNVRLTLPITFQLKDKDDA